MPTDEKLVAEIESAVEKETKEDVLELEAKKTSAKETLEEGTSVDGTPDGKTVTGETSTEEEGTKEGSTEGEGADEEGADEEGTDEGESAEEGEVVEGDSSGKKEISDYVLQKAVQAGLSLDVARSFPSEDSLLRATADLEVAHQEQVRVQERAAAPEKKEEDDILAGLPEIKEEDFEPEVVKTLEAFKSVIAKQAEALNQFKVDQQDAVRAGQSAAAGEVERQFDTQVKNLGDEFSEALGAGDLNSLIPGSSQLAKRDEIAKEMGLRLAGYNASGLQAPPFEEVFDAAARIVLRDEFAQIQSKKLASELKKRQGQHIHRASGQATKQKQTPEEEAAAAIDAKYF